MSAPPPSSKPDGGQILPLTQLQSELWTFQQLHPSYGTYTVPMLFHFEGRLDLADLRVALERMTAIHPALRARFAMTGGSVCQTIAEQIAIDLDVVDVDDPERLPGLLMAEAWRPIDISQSVLGRICLFRTAPGKAVLSFPVHHIAADGWSTLLIESDLAAVLAQKQTRTSDRYEAAVARQVAWETSSACRTAANRLRRNLGGSGGRFWPWKSEGPEQPSPRAPSTFRISHRIEGQDLDALRKACAAAGVSTFEFAAAGLRLFIAASATDVTQFSIVLNARDIDSLDCVGHFTNTLPLAAAASGRTRVGTLIGRVANAVAQLRQAGAVPPALLRVDSTSPLAAVEASAGIALIQGNPPGTTRAIGPSLSMRRDIVLSQLAKFDLAISLYETRTSVEIAFEASQGIFMEAEATLLANRFSHCLTALVRAPADLPVDRLNLLPSTEYDLIDRLAHGEVRDFGPLVALGAAVQATAAICPEAVAVEDAAGIALLSYAELSRRALHIAAYLAERGIGRGAVVAVVAERGADLIAALCGISLAGAAFLTINPDDPPSYQAVLLRNAKPRLVITDRPLPASDLAVETVAVAGMEPVARSAPRLPEVRPLDPAYVIFTSGSTGTPKCARVSQEGIFNRIMWMRETFGAAHARRVLAKTSTSFDVYVAELFWPLIAGGTLVLARTGDGHRNPDHLVDTIADRDITCAHFVPTLLGLLLAHPQIERCRGKLPLLLTSGERLDAKLAATAASLFGGQVANLYGPAEAAVDVTCQPDASGRTGPVTIGRPIANIGVHLLDPARRAVPVGAIGEIAVTGPAVGLGYCNPGTRKGSGFGSIATRRGDLRSYRTGDYGRYLPSGEIAFHGRIDRQVKINGQRVELGAVEAALLADSGITQAAVIARDNGLTAYVVTTDPDCTGDAIKRRIAQDFPQRMVPRDVIAIPEMPLNRSGKIDWARLPKALPPDPGPTAHARALHGLEEIVADIWSAVLGRAITDPNTDFFEAGGDSLRAVIATYKLRERGYQARVEDSYSHPRLQALAGLLALRGPESEPAREAPFAPFGLLSQETRTLLPSDAVDAFPTTRLQAAINFHAETDPNYSCYVSSYEIAGRFDARAVGQAFDLIARQHPILRTSFEFTQYPEAVQIVWPFAQRDVEVEPADHLDNAAFGAVLRQRLTELRRQRFDWTRAPLCKVLVHTLGPERFQLTLAEPILDGWSVAVLVVELLDAYGKILAGEEPSAAAPSPQRPAMAAFVAEERRILSDPAALDFWTAELGGLQSSQIPEIPGAVRLDRSTRTKVAIGAEADAQIKAIARSLQVPVASVLAAIHIDAMAMVSGQQIVATGYMTNGRVEEPGAERAIGLFLNPTPLVIDTGVATWAELIRTVGARLAAIQPYRRYPFAALCELVDAPLTDAVFNYTHFWRYQEKIADGIEVRSRTAFDQTYFPLTVQASTDWRTGRVSLELEFGAGVSGGVDRAATITALYGRIVDDLCENWQAPRRARPALSQAERVRLQRQDLPEDIRDPGFNALLERACRQHGEAVALCDNLGTRTFAQVDARTRAIAWALRQRGMEGRTVAVSGSRSVEFVELVVGIIRAGAVYLPIDADWPDRRVAEVIALADVALVATPHGGPNGGAHGLPGQPPKVSIDTLVESGSASIALPLPEVGPDRPAYILFTSGTSGSPKGARLAHRGLINHLFAKIADFGLGSDTVLAQNARATFDISIWQMLVTLVAGGTTHIVADADAVQPDSLIELVELQKTTHLELVPALLGPLIGRIEDDRALGKRLASLRLMVVTGEAFQASLAKRWFGCMPNVPLANAYGPTECSDDVTHHIVASPDKLGAAAIVPIGRPIRATRLYVVDKQGCAVPMGTPGELVVAGAGVGLDYINNPTETAKRFAQSAPQLGEAGRVYRTGDLVTVDLDGMYHFLGRLDQQVKVNGVRIEPAEIAQCLADHAAIGSAYVAALPVEPAGTLQLRAYLVDASAAARPSIDELVQWLAQRLPHTHLPAAWCWIETFPLNANGKIDAARLPVPQHNTLGEKEPPRPGLEAVVAEIIHAELRQIDVGRNEAMAHLGVNSLTALRIGAKLGKRLGAKVYPQIITAQATIATIAATIAGETGPAGAGTDHAAQH